MEIAAGEFKARCLKLMDEVQATGEEVVITKRGKPVAKLVPVKKESTVEERRARIERWRETSKGLSLGGLKIKDLINEGRR